MEMRLRAKKWGHSLAVVLPRALVRAKQIREDDEIVVSISKRVLARELFGRFPRPTRISAQRLKDEARRGWNP